MKSVFVASRLVGVSLLAIFWFGVCANAEDQLAKYDATTSVEVPSKRRFVEFAGSYKCVARLNPLPSGKLCSLKIRIHNTEDFDLPISGVSVSCGCTKAKLLSNVLEAGASTDLVVDLKTPARHQDGVFSGYVKLEIDPKLVAEERLTHVNVMMSVPLEGMLCFQDRMLVANVDSERTGKLRIPLVNTTKTPLDEIEINATGDLQGVEGDFIRGEEGGSFIELEIGKYVFGSDGDKKAFGTIAISDPRSGVTDTINLVMIRTEAVELSPSVLRFRLSEKSEDALMAHAILRLTPEPTKDEPIEVAKTNSSKAIALEAAISGQSIKAHVKKLGANVYRVVFECPRSVLEKLIAQQPINGRSALSVTVKWRAVYSKTTYSGNAAAVFPVSNSFFLSR